MLIDKSHAVLVLLTATACNTLLFEQSDGDSESTGGSSGAVSSTSASTFPPTSTSAAQETGSSEGGEGSQGISTGPGSSEGTTTSSVGTTGSASTTGDVSTTGNIGETSTGDSDGTATTDQSACGNGIVEGDEQCDDENKDQQDDCKNDCTKHTCGDGLVKIGVERCDNPDDPKKCSKECQQQVVFVTSEHWNGDLGGLEGADAKCQTAAMNAPTLAVLQELKHTTYRAWVSQGEGWDLNSIGVKVRLPHSAAPYVLLDETPVAAGWSHLTKGPIDSPINRTENNSVLMSDGPIPVWTNSEPSGADSGTFDCGYWSLGVDNFLDNDVLGGVGNANATGNAWTKDAVIFCNFSAHLYCIEINCMNGQNKDFGCPNP